MADVTQVEEALPTFAAEPPACVAVIGTGSWGTAAAGLIAKRSQRCILWGRDEAVCAHITRAHVNPRHLTSYQLPDNVSATTDFSTVGRAADALVLAVPSRYLRDTLKALSPHRAKDVPTLVLTKGIEPITGALMTDIVSQELISAYAPAALSGPNHAEEISAGSYAAAVVASQDPACAAYFQRLVCQENFRVYTSTDIIGVEASAAIKNVIALACGVAVGLGAGDNTLAALMTRGVAEMGRLVTALGGDPLTCMGLAGMGDLVATCTSRHSRNRSFGEAFAKGQSLEAYQARTSMVVEGAAAAQSIFELSQKLDIEAPITSVVHAILYEGLALDEAIATLLNRRVRNEFYGFDTKE
ncbi:MAG: NAD(P)H-dependent glycerol-3-phosphate dehydrogenase [Atopobiaceae bacterium]|jgi:glycerol-3-phosphate dehydrogenase (NAD(P)+)